MTEEFQDYPEPKVLAKIIQEGCEDAKAADIKIYDVSDTSSLNEIHIVCTGNSEPHLKAICQSVEKKLKEHNFPFPIKDTEKFSQWMVIDCDSIMLHVFASEARRYYDPEKLWQKGGTEEFIKNWECPDKDILEDEFQAHAPLPKWDF